MSSSARNQYSMSSSYYKGVWISLPLQNSHEGDETIEFNFATLNLERS